MDWDGIVRALPHDLQDHVWALYKQRLQGQRDGRHRRLAATFVEQAVTLCNDVVAAGYLLDWMAHMVQHPHAKPPTAIVLVGHEDCGVSVLVTLLSRLIPTLQTHDPRDVYGTRNGRMAAAKLVVIEQADQLSVSSLKSLIRDPHVLIRERGVAQLVPSFHHLLLTTRELRPSLYDRRFVPIHCAERPSSEYAGTLHQILTTPALDAVRDVLRARPLHGRTW